MANVTPYQTWSRKHCQRRDFGTCSLTKMLLKIYIYKGFVFIFLCLFLSFLLVIKVSKGNLDCFKLSVYLVSLFKCKRKFLLDCYIYKQIGFIFPSLNLRFLLVKKFLQQIYIQLFLLAVGLTISKTQFKFNPNNIYSYFVNMKNNDRVTFYKAVMKELAHLFRLFCCKIIKYRGHIISST